MMINSTVRPTRHWAGEEKMKRDGEYKLTEDFEIEPYSGKFVRDINFTPDDRRLPDIAVCRIFTDRDDAEFILACLINRS